MGQITTAQLIECAIGVGTLVIVLVVSVIVILTDKSTVEHEADKST
jgi:hypothetical protein